MLKIKVISDFFKFWCDINDKEVLVYREIICICNFEKYSLGGIVGSGGNN